MSTNSQERLSFVIRVSNVGLDSNAQDLLKQVAAADENVEIIPEPSPPPPTIVTNKRGYPTSPITIRPRNSFLARVTRKRRSTSKSKRKKSRTNFLKQLQVKTKAGAVEVFHQLDDKIPHRGKEVEMSSDDIRKMDTPRHPAPFASSPGIQQERNSYLNMVSIAKVRESCGDHEVEQKERESRNSEMVGVQAEYIVALESEVKRTRVSSDLLSRSLKMKVERLEELLRLKNRQLMRKDLELRSLQSDMLIMEKEIQQKDNIIDIQGQFIEKLEEENAKQVERLNNNQSISYNSGIAQDVFTDYSKVSTML